MSIYFTESDNKNNENSEDVHVIADSDEAASRMEGEVIS